MKSLDKTISLKVPQGVSDGEVLKVVGLGVPRENGSRGDLLIEIRVQIPKHLNKKMRDAIEELKKEGI